MSEMRTYTFPEELDKSEWGEGPWQSEPDKAVWVDDASGLDCMVVRNHVGSLCGYVGVPVGHPWHGKGYDDVEPYPDIHGGLTFAGPCFKDMREDQMGVCHNPVGRPDGVWWLGFDTAHCYDLSPAMNRLGGAMTDDVYRNLDYVKAEITNLVLQVVAAK